MKKHLIAAAVAGAFAVPAMAQVTISGSLEYSAIADKKVTETASSTAAQVVTKSNGTGVLNNWTTNQLVISGSEDLGGGLKAGFTINSHVNNGAGVGSRDTNVNVSGGFGTVRIGRFVPAAANGYHGFSGAGSTAVGSVYHINGASGDRARFTSAGGSGNMERNDNQIQYTSNSIGGLTVNVNYGTDSSDSSGTVGKREVTQQGIAVSYAAGPLSLGAGMADREVTGTLASNWGAFTVVAPITAAAESATKVEGKLTYFGGSYNLGVASVAVTNVSRKDETTASGVKTVNVDLSVTSLGVSVPMGATTLAASMYQGDNEAGAGAADNTELSGYQASLRYALSKRTTVYALIGENTIKRDGAASTTAARKETGNMIGLLHTF